MSQYFAPSHGSLLGFRDRACPEPQGRRAGKPPRPITDAHHRAWVGNELAQRLNNRTPYKAWISANRAVVQQAKTATEVVAAYYNAGGRSLVEAVARGIEKVQVPATGASRVFLDRSQVKARLAEILASF